MWCYNGMKGLKIRAQLRVILKILYILNIHTRVYTRILCFIKRLGHLVTLNVNHTYVT